MRLFLVVIATLSLAAPAFGQTRYMEGQFTELPQGYLLEHCDHKGCSFKRDTSGDPPGVCIPNPDAEPLPSIFGNALTSVAGFFFGPAGAVPTRTLFNFLAKGTDAVAACEQWGAEAIAINMGISFADAMGPFTQFVTAKSDEERLYWAARGVANWTYPIAGDLLALVWQMKVLNDVMSQSGAPTGQAVPLEPPRVIMGNAPQDIRPQVARSDIKRVKQTQTARYNQGPRWRVAKAPKQKPMQKWAAGQKFEPIFGL